MPVPELNVLGAFTCPTFPNTCAAGIIWLCCTLWGFRRHLWGLNGSPFNWWSQRGPTAREGWKWHSNPGLLWAPGAPGPHLSVSEPKLLQPPLLKGWASKEMNLIVRENSSALNQQHREALPWVSAQTSNFKLSSGHIFTSLILRKMLIKNYPKRHPCHKWSKFNSWINLNHKIATNTWPAVLGLSYTCFSWSVPWSYAFNLPWWTEWKRAIRSEMVCLLQNALEDFSQCATKTHF